MQRKKFNCHKNVKFDKSDNKLLIGIRLRVSSTGVLGGQLLGLLGVATGSGGMDIGSIIGSIAGGGVSGGVLLAIIGVIKNAMGKK
jgi:hypothetical protein